MSSDLQVLDNLLMRIASLDVSKLEETLPRVLPKILPLLAEEETRNKTLQVLNVILNAVKSNQDVKLPIDELTELYARSDLKNSFVENFTVMFMELAFSRTETVGEILLKRLCTNLAEKSAVILARVFAIYLQCACKFGIPVFDINEVDRAVLMAQIAKYFSTAADSFQSQKLALVKNMSFPPQDCLVPLIIASCDTHHSVVTAATDALKVLRIDLESSVIEVLLTYVLDKAQADNVRIKMMEYVCKSSRAANSFPNALKVLFECLFGTPKLRRQGCMFLIHTCKISDKSKFPESMGKLFIGPMIKILGDSYIYPAFGSLFNRFPTLVDLKIVKLFFEAWEKSPNDDISAGLSYLHSALMTNSTSTLELKSFLMSVLDNNHGILALKWLNSLFPFSDSSVRYTCLMHTGTIWPHHIREEANRGLKPIINLATQQISIEASDESKYASQLSNYYPNWSEFLTLCNSSLDYHAKPSVLQDLSEIFNVLSFSHRTLNRYLCDYLHSTGSVSDLLKQAGKEFAQNHSSTFSIWMEMINYGLNCDVNKSNAVNLQIYASELLLELLSSIPEYFLPIYENQLRFLSSRLLSCCIESQVFLSRAYGLLLKSLSETSIIEELDSMKSNLKSVEKKHASILAIGYLVANLPPLIERLLILLDYLKSDNLGYVAASLRSLAVIGTSFVLPIELGNLVETKATEQIESIWTRVKLVQLFIQFASGRKEEHIHELAIETIGCLCMCDRENQFLDFVQEQLLLLANNKEDEIQFVVGESLVQLCIGSSAWSDSSPVLDNRLDTVLTRLLRELVPYGSSRQRAASTIYLLIFLTKAGQHPAICSKRSDIQETLIFLLGDSRQVTQEAAAKALTVLSQQVDSATREILVSALMKQFSGGVARVTSDTVLESAGSGASTYKELCSVAQDMGQPDLAYKFFDMASSSAIWNSKRGIAFTLGSIASVSQSLSSCIPKLFRYQYDPNVKIRATMDELWKNLVPDSAVTIDKYFDAIMAECLSTMSARELRVREASCVAVTDLISGRTYAMVGKHLNDLWIKTLRALDDGAAQDNVRKVAIPLSKAMINLSVRLCDTTFTAESNAQLALSEILPILITKGILDRSSEVRGVSISCLLKLVKIARTLMRPHVADLMNCLLEGLTSLEPNMLSYLQFHTDKINMTEEQLESMRLSLQRSSPMNEAINLCLAQVNASNIDSVVSVLSTQLKSGVGLPTLTGAARAVISLVNSRLPEEIRPHAKTVVSSLCANLSNEASSTVRKLYCTCLATILKVAKKNQIVSVIELLRKMYLNSVASSSRVTAAFLALEMCKLCLEPLKQYFVDILPLVFVGSCDPEADVSKNFQECWEECVPGQTTGLKLYLSEITNLSSELIANDEWLYKKVGLKSLCRVISAIGNDVIFSSTSQNLVKLFLPLLPGRLWDGKEELLEALTLLSEKCTASLTDMDILENMIKAMIAECQRNKKEYRRKAIECVGRMAIANRIVDNRIGILKLLQGAFESVITHVDNAVSLKQTDDEKNEELAVKKAEITFLTVCYESIRKLWISSSDEHKSSEYQWLWDLLLKSLPGALWQCRLACIKTITSLLEVTHEDANGAKITEKRKLENDSFSIPLSENAITSLFTVLQPSLTDTKQVSVREASFQTLKSLIEAIVRQSNHLNQLASIRAFIDQAIKEESDPRVLKLLSQIKEMECWI